MAYISEENGGQLFENLDIWMTESSLDVSKIQKKYFMEILPKSSISWEIIKYIPGICHVGIKGSQMAVESAILWLFTIFGCPLFRELCLYFNENMTQLLTEPLNNFS